MADARAAGARGQARRVDRVCAPRAGGRDRVQRRAEQLPISRRHGAALCARQGLPARQARRRSRYHRRGAADLRGAIAMRTLAEWLGYIERQHPKTIALGLDRVSQVCSRMGVRIDCPVITVGGTNGKGSTCAMLESVLRSAGYRTGLYTSPHLLRYNERVRIGGEPQDDAALVAAFNAVEDARGDVPLTYFEYGTLAAFHAFSRAGLDAVILEVGLGG